jgi:murein DD-endopeptidase MepM/ murein hydrolase activator NlpD
MGRGPWVAAVGADAPVTSGYGLRTHPLTGQPSFHDGLDYGVGCGTPIVAAAAGTVAFAAADPVYGHQIVVEHAGDLETRYGHMYADGLRVEVGDRVQAGQVIGVVGSDGASTGCHLHFTVAQHGQPIDPSLVDAP